MFLMSAIGPCGQSNHFLFIADNAGFWLRMFVRF